MRILICLATGAALLAACGDDSHDNTTPPTASPTVVAATVAPPTATSAACPTPPSGPPFAAVFTGTATATALAQATLTGVASASGPCSDTATFTFAGTSLPAYEVKYVPAITECGSGMPVTTAGTAQITLRFEPAVAHNDSGQPTVSSAPQSPNLPSIKQLKTWCDFEAVVGWVIGTEEKYYTVTEGQNPTRIIVEVYH